MEAVVHRLMLKTYKQVNIVNRPHASTDVRLFFATDIQNVLPVKHRSSVGLFGLRRKSILHTEEVNHSTKSDALQTNKYHSDNLVFIMDVMCKSWKSE